MNLMSAKPPASGDAGAMNSLWLPKAPADTRVVVAMSGGVDSSVTAALLKREGYDVIGITMQLYDHGAATARPGTCCAGQDIRDARRVADAIGIPHYVVNYEERFSEAVISAFAASYAEGETPVPCIACNQTVKFQDLLGTARDLGADAMVTGHYIASRPGPGGWELYRAADASRDQSYFLFATTREQLEVLRFPLGELHKDEIRRLAAEMGLPVASKPDSQDICFVPSGRYTDVIARLRPDTAAPGDIVDLSGRVLGLHDGIIYYTIGQRKGLGIAAGEPLYVVKLDAAQRRVVVGPREALLTDTVELRDMNWLGETPLDAIPAGGLSVWARIRSTQPPQPATLFRGADGVSVVLHTGEHGVSPGQACVLYASGEPRARILGGGWIKATTAAGNVRTGLFKFAHPA